MTNDELRPYLESVNFEDRADAEHEAARIAEYIATHVACRAGHHRPLNPENLYNDPCPVEGCGSLVPHRIDPVDVPQSLR
jgi:hypothetical protein